MFFTRKRLIKISPLSLVTARRMTFPFKRYGLTDKQTKYRRASLLIIMCYRIILHLFFYLPKSDSQLWLLEEEDLTASPPESSAGSDITRSFPLPTNTKTTYKKLKTNFNKSKTTF